jgi:hypothetical protein
MAENDKRTRVLEMIAGGMTQADASAALGLKPRTVSHWVRAERKSSLTPTADGSAPADFEVTRHSAEYDQHGELKKQWVGSKPPPGEVFEPAAGHIIKGESALLDPTGRVLAKWVKTKEGANNAIDGFLAAFAGYDGASPLTPAPSSSDDELLTIYPLADLHVGLYSWGAECGDDYDVEIATDLVRRNIGALVSKSEPSKRAVILGLGDLFHQNDQKNATPGSGHRLDVDGRWPRVFEAGAKLMTSLVDLALQKHEIVDVVLIPGNHDEDASVCLRVALALFYSNNPRVRVNNKPGLHWSMRFGKCLFGASHGHTMKAAGMALMLAVDNAKDWGETLHRNFFFGHIHSDTVKEIGNVRVESFNTPAAKDAYATGSGWRSGRSMSAITFHTEDGEIGRHRVNIPADWARVRAAA